MVVTVISNGVVDKVYENVVKVSCFHNKVVMIRIEEDRYSRVEIIYLHEETIVSVGARQ